MGCAFPVSYKPCLGCGWCCLSDQCPESHRRYGYLKRCPDLFWDGSKKRYLCLLMDDPQIGEDVRQALHAGQGCCAPLCDWRADVKDRG